MADTASILENLAPSLVQVEKLITGLAYIIGVTFLIKGVMSLKLIGEQKSHMQPHHSFREPIFYLLSGSMLLYFPTGLGIVLSTVFGSSDILDYSQMNLSNPILESVFGNSGLFGSNLVLFIQVIGLIAFVRGWIIIAKVGQAGGGGHQATMGKGIMHIIGGVLAINIVQTMNIINNTLYGYS